MTLAVSACVLREDSVKARIITERWLIENILYMMLGVETESFVIHQPSMIVTVKSVSPCIHISRGAIRSALKWYSYIGTRIGKLRSFRIVHPNDVLTPIAYIESAISAEAQGILSKLSDFVEMELNNLSFSIIDLMTKLRPLMSEVGHLIEFHDILRMAVVDGQRGCFNNFCSHILPALQQRIITDTSAYIVSGRPRSETIDTYMRLLEIFCDDDTGLVHILLDVMFLLSSGFNPSWIRQALRHSVSQPSSHHLLLAFEKSTQFTSTCEKIFRTCTLADPVTSIHTRIADKSFIHPELFDQESWRRINVIEISISRLRHISAQLDELWLAKKRENDIGMHATRCTLAKRIQAILHHVLYEILLKEWEKRRETVCIKNRVEGFREFLEIVERQISDFMNKHVATIDHSQRFLVNNR
jgi:hypothetical protein